MKKNRLNYKIWDKKENKWYEPIYEAYMGRLHDLNISSSGDLIARTIKNGREISKHESMFPDRYEVVYSTGITDKNGVDIYEGDVVSYKRNTAEGLVDEQTVIESILDLPDFMCCQELEVVGNVYENPELLNTT